VCFLENAHLKIENPQKIPQEYIYDTEMTTHENVIAVLNIGHGAVLCIDRVQHRTHAIVH
jgi:hypothetical protein